MTTPTDDDKQGYVGRGALKLEAALQLLGGAEKITGARAIDVGASTGGFTESMLNHGAVHVVALDVGHGQLHERLRKDPRVENLEKIHFKTVSLKVAPGPFDFFAVDVSFVSARNMLRPLAFRLKPGAEGIILVKPQFELPEGYVKGGDVKPEGLRAWAVQRVKQKGAELGYQLLGEIDSPVLGGSGTVEILTRWRFVGLPPKLAMAGKGLVPARPAQPPRAPKKAPAQPKKAASPPFVPSRYLALTARGLEAVGVKELSAIPGIVDVKAVEDGIEFSGDPEVLLRAHLVAHSVSHLLVHVGKLKFDPATVNAELAKLPWDRFAVGQKNLVVEVQARGQFAVDGDLLGNSISAAVRARGVEPVADDAEATTMKVLARGNNEVVNLFVDASGEDPGTSLLALAAGLLALAGWKRSTTLIDPFMAQGAIPITAARLALGMPGSLAPREYLSWPDVDVARWQTLLAEAHAATQLPPKIIGYESAERVAEAQLQLARLGLEKGLTLEVATPAEISAPAEVGLVLTDLTPEAQELETWALNEKLRELGELLRTKFSGWQAAVLVADAKAARTALGVRTLDEPKLVIDGRPAVLLKLNLKAK